MTFNITFRSPNGTEQTIQCEEDQYILDAAEESGLVHWFRAWGMLHLF